MDMTQLSGTRTPTSQNHHHSNPNVHAATSETKIQSSASSRSLKTAATPAIGDSEVLENHQSKLEDKSIELQLVTEGEKHSATSCAKLPPAVSERTAEKPVNSSSNGGKTSDVKGSDANSNPPLSNKMTAVQGAVRHREMAVDVPDSFVAVAKTAPRYPPPRKNASDNSSLKKNGHYYFSSESARGRSERSSQDGSEGSRRTPPTPRISELVRGGSETSENRVAQNGNVNHSKDPVSSCANGLELDYIERILKYKEDIRKRKEDEEKLAKEEEFLRSSLRGSKKLQALEKKYKSGVENNAFQLEEGDVGTADSTVPGKLVGDAPEGEPPELSRTYESSELLDMIHNVETCLGKTDFDGDLVDVEKLLHNPEFQSMLSLHNRIQEICCFKCLPTPVCTDSQELLIEVSRSLQDSYSKDAKELFEILDKLEIENLLIAHDKIAENQVTPEMTAEEELLTRVSQYTEESIKIVRIDKTTEPLGATVKNEAEAVIIGRIVKGGVAEKSGLLHEGDEILEVNGIEMRGKTVNDVCDIMASMTGTLTFLIVPSQYEDLKSNSRESVIHLKAHFDYEPDDDIYIPCRELGMSFQKGDVLHVISQDDANWWQAYREGEEDQMLAGLIPSKSFQQQREIIKQAVVGDVKERKSKKGKFLCARKHQKRKKKKLYNLNHNDDADSEQVLTYEEVTLYYPRAYHKRPLVLIGPQKVGRHELRQRLMEDTNRFAAAVPHTSRPRKDGEVNGVDYHFISRAQFESDILAGRFVEHGEYQKSYYGTSLDAIRSVINSGKTCVLNLHPQSLKILKKSDLKPYVVFIAPPSLEKLRQNCLKTDTNVKDEELKEIIEKAREMEEFYGHYFDLVLINVDIEKTYTELLHEISVIEREPQWVPASWMRNETN